MSAEANKTLVRRLWEEVFAQGNVAVADEILAPDFVVHGAGSDDLRGIESLKQFVQGMQERYPGAHPEILGMVAEGDQVAIRWIARDVEEPWAGMSIYRIADGKIAEEWGMVGKPWN